MRKPCEQPSWETASPRRGGWLRERLDLEPLARWLAQKTVPVHRHSWIYLLGGAALCLFGLQVLTGCLLMLYYQPGETTAYASVGRIMNVVPYGWLVRSLHAWGATLFVAATGLHGLSVLLVRAYRRPRELTWVSGILLLFLTLALGFSGYLLPWNELSYHATLVGTTIPGVVPGIGGFVTHVLRGGEQVSGDTITRFYAAHVALLPLAFGGVLAIHLLLVQLQGMSLPAGLTAQQVKDRRPFCSEFALIDAGLWLVILGVLVTLAIFFPAEVGPQADPLKPAPEGIKPDWYFLFLFQTLKWVPESVGVALIGLGSLLLLLVPWLDCPAGRERRSPWFTAVALGLLAYAAAAQAIAWLAPGVEQAREELGSETYRLDVLVPWLVFFWAVIGFLLFFLRQLLRENTRVRKLRAQLPVSSGPAGPGCRP